MLHNVNDLNGFKFVTADGEIGHVADFIVEDDSWTIRYLVKERSGICDWQMT